MLRRIAAFALLFALASASVAEARRCPNIMFVVDKSGSMNQDPSGGGKVPSKWTLVLTQLTQTLLTFADRVPFGLTTFSSFGGGAACYNETSLVADCVSGQKVPGAGQALIQKLNMIMPNGNTNTSEAIRRAYTDSMALKDPVRENYLVLITDGTPNCSNPEPTNTINELKKAAALVNRDLGKEVTKSIEVKEGSGNVFRHSFASCLAANGYSQSLIDEWMGHQTAAMRRRYRHLFPDERKRALATLTA